MSSRLFWSCLFLALCALTLPASATVQQQDGALGAAPTHAQPAEGPQAQARREVTQPGNNAPFWRDVREGETNRFQTTQVQGLETEILVQTEGEIWRQIRNGPITIYGGWLIVGAFLIIAAFYSWRGQIKLHEPRTGREILRFTRWERIVHWTTAGAFAVLAVTGILMLFGRYVILPLMGYTVFASLTAVGKTLHNFAGPLFVACTLLMVVTFIRDNVWRRYDWTWMRRIGDFLKARHVSAGKYNAGEKVWFWFGVLALGVAVSVSGLILDFPNFGQGRQTMQLAHVLHATAAVLFMAMSLGHIYLGTIGFEGSYDAMRHGAVDETWAKEHHDIWYGQVLQEARSGVPADAPSGVAAFHVSGGYKV